MLPALLVFFIPPVLVWALLRPRKRRLTIRALMLLIAAFAVDFLVLARASQLPSRLVLAAAVGLYGLPYVPLALYVRPPLDYALAALWTMAVAFLALLIG